MAIARVQQTALQADSLAYGSNVASGNLLVCCVVSGSDPSSVTDSLGNTWSKVFGTYDGGSFFISCWYCVSGSSGANTVTINGGGTGTIRIWIGEYSGIDATPLDKFASATWSGAPDTAADSGNTATTTIADELLIGVISTLAGTTATWSAGWNELVDHGTVNKMTTADRIVSSTGTYKASATLGAGDYWASGIATFKAAVGGGGTANPSYYQQQMQLMTGRA